MQHSGRRNVIDAALSGSAMASGGLYLACNISSGEVTPKLDAGKANHAVASTLEIMSKNECIIAYQVACMRW